MDIAQLVLFRDAARLGSFAAAARAARVDASAVSRTIAALERELGVRLLQRSTRRLRLTEAGETYLERIDPLIEELAAAREAAIGLVETPRGRLRVSASNAYGETEIAPLIKTFHRAYPQVELELVLTDDLVDLVAERIDVALRLGPMPTGELIVTRLVTNEKRLVASPDYLRTTAAIASPADIGEHVCLVSPSDGYQPVWRFQKQDQQVAVPVSARVATTNTLVLKRCALDGLGLSILSDWLVEEEIAGGALTALLPDWTAAASAFETAVWIVYPSRSFLPLKARVFIDHLRRSRP